MRKATAAVKKTKPRQSKKASLENAPELLKKQTKCVTIENHKDKDKIIDELSKDHPLRFISRKYGVAVPILSEYKRIHLVAPVMEQRMRRYRGGEAILNRNEEAMHQATKMLAACDEYLRDPDNPEKYNLGPRAWEIDVIYRTIDDVTEKLVFKKENLQRVIDRMFEHGMEGIEVRFRQADPRNLLLAASDNLRKALEFNARILKIVEGGDGDTVTNNLHIYLPQKKEEDEWKSAKE